MAGKNEKTGKQPYIPLYIGDWEQDTNMLSLEAEGGWLKIIFKMWKQKNTNLQNGAKALQGVYKISTKALQNLWRKTPDEINEIVEELKHANVCELEYCEGVYTFGNRRMIKEAKISEIRSNAVQTRYKDTYKIAHPSEYEYEYTEEVYTEIQLLLQEDSNYSSLSENEKKLFFMLIDQMIKIFREKFPNSFFDKNVDYTACLQIAYKIATYKHWGQSEVYNGKMEECISEWKIMVDFIYDDEWLSTRSLNDLSTVKEFQRLIQKINKNGRKNTKTVGKDIEFDRP